MPIEHIAIEQGRQPWAPSPGCETVDTFHFYDLPLIGIVRQAQQLHLFRCLEGHAAPYSLWAYVNVSPDEAAQLRAATSEEFDDVVSALTAKRPTVVALAHENAGIVASALVARPADHPTLLHAARAALRSATAEVDDIVSRGVA